MVNLAELEGIARGEFADTVLDVSRIGAKLRMLLIDGSYIDFSWSEIQEGRFGHHTFSDAGLLGGGHVPMPAEVSLAHHRVRFLDELPECRRHVLEVLRQPLDERITGTISRAWLSLSLWLRWSS
jgi:predicted ATPase with chaperone activity